MSRGWLTPRVAIIPAIAAAAALSLTAVAGPAAQAAPAAGGAVIAAATAISPQQAGLDTMMGSYGSNHLIGTDWWQAAVAQSTLQTYEQATGDTTYSGDIGQTYSTYNGKDPSGKPDFEDSFVDDTGWWGVAWLQAYLMTGNSSYLQTAEADASFMDKQWNTNASACGGTGGVWWEITSSGDIGRLSIPNELFLELAAWLYNVTGNSTYLSWAEAEWSWFDKTGLITSSNVVDDGYNGACQVGGDVWSYNQGVIVAGLAQLYLATKNASLLTEAENIATAAIAKLAPSGVLADTCQPSSCDGDETSFKGIFVRDLKMLATVAGTSQYNAFFAAQAASVEAHDTDAGHQMGLVWSASVTACPAALTTANPCNSQTQVSAEDALVAALGPPPARPATVVNSSGTVWAFARVAGGGLDGSGLEADSLAKGATSWSGFTSLSGTTPYGPAAVAASNGSTRVFVVGANGALYVDTLPAGSSTWSGWSSLSRPASVFLIGIPAVVQDNTGVIRAFIRGENGNLYTDSLSGSTWSGFSDLGGTWPSDVAALVGKGGFVHVFAVGTTGNLYHDQMAAPSGSWSGWSDLSGQVTGVPAVTQDSGGTIRAYARDTSNGALQEFWAASGSSSYSTDSHAGDWPYDEAAVSDSGAHVVSLFGIGTTGNAYWQYLTTTPSWSAWNDLAGSFTGVPAGVELSNGDIDLFADSAGSLEVNQLAGSTWSGWTTLGGNLS
jgi:predicted alpha-1,6-mannanase (GH76 family)